MTCIGLTLSSSIVYSGPVLWYVTCGALVLLFNTPEVIAGCLATAWQLSGNTSLGSLEQKGFGPVRSTSLAIYHLWAWRAWPQAHGQT